MIDSLKTFDKYIQSLGEEEQIERRTIDRQAFLDKAAIVQTIYDCCVVEERTDCNLRPAGATVLGLHAEGDYQGCLGADFSQSWFEEWYANEVRHTSVWLRGSRPSAQDVMDVLSLDRYAIARAIGAQSAELFGMERINEIETSMNAQRYQKYKARVSQLNSQFAQGMLSAEERISLTTYQREFIREFLSLSTMTTVFCIRHTSVNNMRQAWTKIRLQITDVANKILDRERNAPLDTLRDLAFIHWWLAHLCLFERGSASITESYILSLCIAAGFKEASWAEGNFPDLEALCCLDLEKFQEDYGRDCLQLCKSTPI